MLKQYALKKCLGGYKMRASESHPNFKSKVREYTNYSIRNIKKICKDIGPRPAGSAEELKAQEYMAKDLENNADTVEIESFELHPRAFMGWFRVDGFLLLLAIAFFFIGLPILTLILSLLAVIFLIGEFLFYKEFLDPLYKKATSHNLVAVRKPTGQIQKRIIFCGHIDSSYEWRFTHLGGKVLLFAGLISAAVGLGFVLVMSIIAVTQGYITQQAEGLSRILGFVSLAFIPSFIGLCLFLNDKVIAEGANDNLTGCLCSASIIKYLSDNDIRFENTEVIALLTGSEEAGLRGAKAFAKKHKKEYEDAQTVVVAIDTLRDYEHFSVYSRDMSGTVKNHPQACALLKKAGEYANIELPYSSIYAGASDAAAITQAGMPAVAIAAMDPGPPRYYHTRGDTSDNLEPKTIEKGIEVCLEALYLFDEKGLTDSY